MLIFFGKVTVQSSWFRNKKMKAYLANKYIDYRWVILIALLSYNWHTVSCTYLKHIVE